MSDKSPYHVFVIKPDGTISHSEQAKAPEYPQLRDTVHGYIETVPYFSSLVHQGKRYFRGKAYCNENGLSEGLQLNRTATSAWRKACPKGDPSMMVLVGDVIFYAKSVSEEAFS
jgi:hypothetical protein